MKNDDLIREIRDANIELIVRVESLLKEAEKVRETKEKLMQLVSKMET